MENMQPLGELRSETSWALPLAKQLFCECYENAKVNWHASDLQITGLSSARQITRLSRSNGAAGRRQNVVASKSFKRWSDKDKRFLRKNWSKLSATQIAITLGRSYTTCFHQAKRLGLKRSLGGVREKGALVPLKKLKQWQLGYLAGIIDGEGTIACSVANTKGHSYVRPGVYLTTTCILLAPVLAGIGCYLTKCRNIAGVEYIKASLGSWDACRMLVKALYPFLTVKRPQAALFLKLASLRSPLGWYDNPLGLKEFRDTISILYALNDRRSSALRNSVELRTCTTSSLI